MAQYNFDHDPAQHSCLHLLIANFGTKGAAPQTVPILMQQIKLYASSDPQHFTGVVGLPFSRSVTPALYTRSGIPGDDIPMISSSAVADSFVDPPNATPPNNFYANFYRVVPSVLVESKVLADFVLNHLPSTQTSTLLFEDKDEKYSQALGSAIYQPLGAQNTVYYTEGDPGSLDSGINELIQSHYTQIFFSGFADDLNALKNKLAILGKNGKLTWDIRIVGGEGLYDLGSYNNGNYANLFFAINASYAQISHDISPNSIPDNANCPSQKVLPFNSNFNYEFCHLFNQGNPPSTYGYELPSHHVILMYDAVDTFLQALPSGSNTTAGPLWQVVNQNLPKVQFPGVTGMIQFAPPSNNAVNNPTNKPTYIACTDSNGFTHPVGQYVNGTLSPPGINQDQLNQCLNK